MDSKTSSSLPVQQAAKAAYSSPKLEDLGAIEEIALGGVGSMAEMMRMADCDEAPVNRVGDSPPVSKEPESSDILTRLVFPHSRMRDDRCPKKIHCPSITG